MDQPLPSWHGSIRHVQTSQEIHFTQIGDALGFMAQFVEIEKAEQASGKQQTPSASQSHA
ncbi:MAG: hypothetical protein KC421_08930 [Anaerolineales bacterium]|nr:hypothetical protein [Anaerolineales bacterium]